MDIEFITSYSLLGFLVLSILVLAFCFKDYYFIYDHRLLFVIGLVFSRSLTHHAVTDQIMWYFTDNDDDSFVRAAVFSNIQDSLSSLFVIFMAHSADSFIGRFRTLVFSTTAYICGLLVMWLFNPYDVTWLITMAIVLLALGKSGDTILEYVLTDLVDGIDTSVNRNIKRSLARREIWWRISYVFGAIAAILWVAPFAFGLDDDHDPTWKTTFFICIISMTAALIIFCIGHNVYHQRELTQRPVEIFFRVLRAKLQKLLNSNSRQERSPKSTMQENEGITQDRSPINEYTTGKRSIGNTTYKDDIKVVRSLLRMFPMWGTLIVVSLTSAIGSTFYIEQFNNLRGNDKIPAQMFDMIQDFSGFVILILYGCTPFFRNEKLKIGVGMLCSILSCLCAFLLEFKRLKQVHKLGDQDEETSISFLGLVPQFCILGCMEGLTEDGSLRFFKSQIAEPIKSYSEEYMEVVMCLGKLVNIFLILILRKWFGYNVNDTRLDKYYLLLVSLCSVNFIIYCCIVKCFYKGSTEEEPHFVQDRLQVQVNEGTTHATTWNKYKVNRFLSLLSRQVSLVFNIIF